MSLSLRRSTMPRGGESEYLRQRRSGRMAHHREAAEAEHRGSFMARRAEFDSMGRSFYGESGGNDDRGENVEGRVAEIKAQRKADMISGLVDLYAKYWKAGLLSPNEPHPDQLLRQMRADLGKPLSERPHSTAPSIEDFASRYWQQAQAGNRA